MLLFVWVFMCYFVFILREKQFRYLGIKLRKVYLKNLGLVWFSTDHQWDRVAKLVIVFKEKAGFKDIIGLASVDEKVLYFSSENPYFWGLTMLPFISLYLEHWIWTC